VLIMKFQTSKEEKEQLESFGEVVFSRVLCPVDFSKPSRELLTWIKRIPIISEIVFLHVIKSAESREELQKAILEAEENLGLLRDEFNRDCRDLEVKINVEFGNPAEKICSVAREEDVTLIAIPRHGKSDYITNIPLGSTVAEVAKRSQRPVFVRSPHIVLEVQVRELFWNEFSLAEKIWRKYHGQHADRVNDRIFGVFVEGSPVAVARCKRHPDGLEVDGVFVLNDFRGRGYARLAVEELVNNCGSEPLYMHSTLELVEFYGSFGFREIDESELPDTIRERFNFAKGELEGANVSPMRRLPGEKKK
jgi:nucleotide-binding universal stress UspA family protein/N-acetylglutamate synthase-like GNAT family acetyltransferase